MAWELNVEGYPTPTGPLRYSRVPWDSETFGIPIHELSLTGTGCADLDRHLPGLLEHLRATSPCLMSAKLPVGGIDVTRTLTQHGFYLVEVGIELGIEFEQLRRYWTDRPTGLVYRDASADDIAVLREIAKTGLAYDRFHMDPNISSEKASQRFQTWVERGVVEGDPTLLFTREADGRAIGFFQYRPWPRGIAYMSLASVRGEFRSTGLGMMMVERSLVEIAERGFRGAVARSTLNNLDVIRMCSALGFQTRDCSYTFHWYHPG